MAEVWHFTNTPWEVTEWMHHMHPDEITKDYKSETSYLRPVIVDANGLFVAEFGVGLGFEAAKEIAKAIVELVNHQDGKEFPPRNS